MSDSDAPTEIASAPASQVPVSPAGESGGPEAPPTGFRSAASPARIRKLLEVFDAALVRLGEAKPFAKSRYQIEVQQVAHTLLESPEGLQGLYERAHLFQDAGVFSGGPWNDPRRLLSPLVRGCLLGEGVYPIMEVLSELRMLALATGRAASQEVSPEDSVGFLERVLALNLDLLYGKDTEETRNLPADRKERAVRVFRLVLRELPTADLVRLVAEEVSDVCAQRPIMVDTVHRTLRLVREVSEGQGADLSQLLEYLHALEGPSELSRQHPGPGSYRKALRELDEADLEKEADRFAETLRSTGLASPHQAVLLRHLRRHAPELVARSLGLNTVGQAEVEHNEQLVHELISVGVYPSTSQWLYGFARTLERGLLSRPEVAGGLERLIQLDLRREVKRALLGASRPRDGATANSILVAGALAVLGQPLGVGQGNNPTCQAARGISLWSQYHPGFLLELVATAARDGLVELDFEGQRLVSDKLPAGLAKQMDFNLDPVSIVLVPHLDRLYDEMMRRVALRNEDGHRWVNPTLYGRGVPSGFLSLFDKLTGTVENAANFVRVFFATHHPSYNEGHALIFPNPVGICVTNTHGMFLGPHAVTLQRVEEDEGGAIRVYFYNPNNEGRQDWGHDVVPSVKGHGEVEGESSLPFEQFVSRLYAFHYNPYEQGDGYAVPDEVIDRVLGMARESWGKAFTWDI